MYAPFSWLPTRLSSPSRPSSPFRLSSPSRPSSYAAISSLSLPLFLLLLLLLPLTASAQPAVALNTDGLDAQYVESIKGRSQKIVDGLALNDPVKAENVRNIIANRYFLLNSIHSKYDKTQQDARDAELYKHHFELASALAAYLTD